MEPQAEPVSSAGEKRSLLAHPRAAFFLPLLLLPFLLFLLALVRLFLSGLMPFDITASEFLAQGYAYQVFQERAIAEGLFPLWTSNAMCGLPLYAFSHFSFFYPFNFRWLPHPFSVYGFMLFHDLGFALGCFFLFRWLGLTRLAAGLASALSLCFILIVPGWGSVLAETTLTPWLFFASFSLFSRPSFWRWFLLALILFLMATAGHVEVMAYSLLGLVCLHLVFHGQGRLRLTWKGSAVFLLAAALAVLLSLVQLLPLQEYVDQGVRNQGITLNYFLAEKIPFINPRLLLAWALSPVAISHASRVSSPLLYFCLLAAFLRPESRRTAFYLLLVIGLFLFYALAGAPLTRWLIYLPLFGQLIRVFAFSYFAGVVVLMVAALGLANLFQEPGSRLFSVAGWVLPLSAVVCNLVSLFLFKEFMFGFLILSALHLLLVIGWFFFRSHPARSVLILWLMVTVALVEYVFVFYKNSEENLGVDFASRINPQSEIRGEPARFALLSEKGAFDWQQPYHLGLIHDTYELWTMVTIPPRRLCELWAEVAPDLVRFAGGRLDRYRVYPDSYTGHYLSDRALPFLQLLGLRYLYDQPTASPPHSSFQLKSTQKFALFENPAAFPLEFIIHEAFLAPDPSARSWVTTADSRELRRRIALAPSPNLPANLTSSPELSGEEIKTVEKNPGYMTFRLHLGAPGFFFQSENYYPGWRAFLDEREVPLLRADYAFRAVFLPPGEHTLSLKFMPLPFRIGLWSSLGSFFFFLGGGAAKFLFRK